MILADEIAASAADPRDAPPLEVVAISAQISTHGVLLFRGGTDGTTLLRALSDGEWRRVELVGDA